MHQAGLGRHHTVGKRAETTLLIQPEGDFFASNYRPDPAIARCHCLIGYRRVGRAIGMRMIITGHLRAAFTCCAVRIHQCLWIDFKMRLRCGVYIARGGSIGDLHGLPQQYATAFVRHGGARLCLDLVNDML